MARLSILSLGTLHLTLDDVPLTGFDSDKARALLAFLAIESHCAHRRERLAGLLWPEYPEHHARHTLSQVIYNLRHIIGDRNPDRAAPFLDVTPQTLRFNHASDYWLDVDLFTALSSSPSPDVQHCIACCEQAVTVYRGHFLEGLSFPDSPAFEEWILTQRERWLRVALETLTRLVEGYAHLGDYDRALHHAWRQLDLDPWREDAHRRVMRLLALSGQRSAALAQYDTCRRTLLSELDAEPEPETAALYEAIKTGALPAHPAVPVSHVAPPHNLPAQLTPLIGRETELATLRVHLQEQDCRLLTLVGPGGIGKTRLALEVVAPLVPAYTHGVFFVSLTPLQSAQTIVPTISQAIGFTFSDKGGTQEAQLLAYLKHKTMLLILDNAEHLLRPRATERSVESAAITVANLLEAAPGVKIVVTSRVGLNVLGETRFAVPALTYPEGAGRQPAPVYEDLRRHLPAVQLFVQGARRLRPTFALTAKNAQAVSDICRIVQGLPLALLLTAHWVATLSTAEIAALLTGDGDGRPGDVLDLLETDWPNVPPRHRSLRAVFEQSWDLLSAREQDVCKAFAVFRGGCTQADAFHVAGATPQDLRALVDASFLHRETSGRYTMQELLRQYTAEKLADDPTAAWHAHDRHCAYYVAVLQRWAEDSKGPRQQDVLLEMDIEIGNARAAWEWAVAQGDSARIDQAVQGLCLFYERRIRRPEGEAACRAAAERLEALSASTPVQEAERLRVLAKVLTWQSRFLPREQALVVIERTLALLDHPELTSLDVRAEQAAARQQTGHIMMGTDRQAAKRFYEQSLGLYRAVGATWEVELVLLDLGWYAWHSAAYEEAQRFFAESLRIAQTWNDLRGMAWTIQGLSGVAMQLGQLEEAVRLTQESLALRREMGDLAEIANGLYSLGFKYIALGQSAKAVPFLEECRTLTCDQLGLPGGYVYSVLAYARMLMGQYKPAYPLARTALQKMQDVRDQRGVGWVYHILAGIALGLDEFAEAEQSARSSAEAYRPLEQRQELTFALAYLSYSLWAQGRLAEMKPLLGEVLHIWQAIGAPHSLMYALVGMALLSVNHGQAERAVELYAMASRLSPCIENCHWFSDIAGRHVEAAAEALSPERIAAAQARGLARDAQATVAELLVLLQDE
jgi:predicted ATPase/DNA-binding SARP family transcriptional activator